MNNTKVSFIVVSYNNVDYINEAINSVLDLNINYNYEIIIGDDGSSDGSIKIIKDFHDKSPDKIKYFVMDREPGLTGKDVIGAIRCSNVIKRGIKEAIGEYILILSSDDYYIDKTFVDEAIEYMDNHNEYVALVHDAINFNKNKDLEYFDFPNSLFWSREYIHVSNYFIRNTKSFKDSLLTYFCDDTGMAYIIYTLGKVKYRNKKIFEYRPNDTGIMRSSDFNELMFMEIMLYQDILNNGDKLKISSLRRFCYAMFNLYHDKEKLSDKRYDKYITHLRSNDNDIYAKYMHGGFLYRASFIIRSYIVLTYFYIWRKLYKIL